MGTRTESSANWQLGGMKGVAEVPAVPAAKRQRSPSDVEELVSDADISSLTLAAPIAGLFAMGASLAGAFASLTDSILMMNQDDDIDESLCLPNFSIGPRKSRRGKNSERAREPQPTNKGKKWTQQDDELLRQLRASDKSYSHIAQRVGRTRQAVAVRISQLQRSGLMILNKPEETDSKDDMVSTGAGAHDSGPDPVARPSSGDADIDMNLGVSPVPPSGHVVYPGQMAQPWNSEQVDLPSDHSEEDGGSGVIPPPEEPDVN